ncbi:MAG: primosomal protein N' [Gammaproteobacteria bacterium]|nr:primosomal protein N' [Gammaproteobacteria bacterium]
MINLRQQPLTGGLSRPLIQACEKHLKAGGQVLIFINRRGYSPVLMCHDCGWMAICPRCDRYFTLHQKPPRLSCHHCESQRPIPSTCPECKSDHALIDVGVGTEKVEAALKALFPTYNVLRIDRSSVTKKGEMHECLTQIHNGDADILVGTQMLAKGHHFSRLRMVGILGVDDSLFSNDFHATERLGQLILQVAGRAGRDDSDGEVFIQTHHTDHPLLNILLQQGYGPFAQHLLAEREAAHWPPFSYLALIRAEAHEFSKSFEALNTLKEHLKTLNLPHLNILGPLPAFLAKRAGLFRAQLILQADDRKTLHQALFQLDDWLNHHATRQVRISLDIDPKEMG